jgi:hypothetical protein
MGRKGVWEGGHFIMLSVRRGGDLSYAISTHRNTHTHTDKHTQTQTHAYTHTQIEMHTPQMRWAHKTHMVSEQKRHIHKSIRNTQALNSTDIQSLTTEPWRTRNEVINEWCVSDLLFETLKKFDPKSGVRNHKFPVRKNKSKKTIEPICNVHSFICGLTQDTNNNHQAQPWLNNFSHYPSIILPCLSSHH